MSRFCHFFSYRSLLPFHFLLSLILSFRQLVPSWVPPLSATRVIFLCLLMYRRVLWNSDVGSAVIFQYRWCENPRYVYKWTVVYRGHRTLTSRHLSTCPKPRRAVPQSTCFASQSPATYAFTIISVICSWLWLCGVGCWTSFISLAVLLQLATSSVPFAVCVVFNLHLISHRCLKDSRT